VNAVSRQDAFPIPDIQDALDNLRGSKYYITMDLLSGYWQLPISDRAKDRSAFCTKKGLVSVYQNAIRLVWCPWVLLQSYVHFSKGLVVEDLSVLSR